MKAARVYKSTYHNFASLTNRPVKWIVICVGIYAYVNLLTKSGSKYKTSDVEHFWLLWLGVSNNNVLFNNIKELKTGRAFWINWMFQLLCYENGIITLCAVLVVKYCIHWRDELWCGRGGGGSSDGSRGGGSSSSSSNNSNSCCSSSSKSSSSNLKWKDYPRKYVIFFYLKKHNIFHFY